MNQEIRLGFQLKQIHDKFRKNINVKLSKYDITLSQFRVLDYLFFKSNEGVTQKDIERFTELRHPTVIGILQRLEEKSFVRSEKNTVDKRFRNIILTDKAIVLKSDLDNNKEFIDSMLIKGMSEQEVLELKTLLDKVINNLSEI